MSTPTLSSDASNAANRHPKPASGAPAATSAPTLAAKPSPTPGLPWSSENSSLNSYSRSSTDFSQISATTAEILNRIRAQPGNVAGTPAFEAKRAEVLQSYVTSDKLPTPPPISNTGRRGRGGKAAPPSQLKTEVVATPVSGTTPTSARGSGRGRGRGRGRGGGSGRGGKRKRSESFEDSDNDSEISDSYTPLPTRTKSGRNVNRPVTFVPTLPEPTPAVKRRRSVKTILAAQCKTCHRGTDPGNNRIVFCDVCNTAYHQYCHDPPIGSDVVTVLEKEWLCGPCKRSKQDVIKGTEGLVAGDGLSIDDKRAYLSTLPAPRLVSLLLHGLVRHPELPIFPPNIDELIPDRTTTTIGTKPKQLPNIPAPSRTHPIPTIQQPTPATAIPFPTQPTPSSATNGLNSTTHTPRSLNLATDSSDVDPAEAQLLREIQRSRNSSPSKPGRAPSSHTLPAPIPSNQDDDFEDGYDTDPPAHYPKAGNGLARTLRPETEDIQWLVDDNFEVFSHGWKGDGSGVGADGEIQI